MHDFNDQFFDFRRWKNIHQEKGCAGVLATMIQSSAQNHIFYDDVHGAQNHYFYGCEQCAKMGGGATIYYVYMYVRTPPSGG